MGKPQLIDLVKRIQAIAHLGLAYGGNEYDQQRYTDLQNITRQMLTIITNEPLETIANYYSQKKEYITPKVDIRAVVFNQHKQILLVKEKEDGLWSLPGGWADIGFSPNEIAVNEVKEETGLEVTAVKLLAVLDKKCHPHPPEADYVYKFFIQCKIQGGDFEDVFDILEKGFFSGDALPPLSLKRVLPSQIALMFHYLADPLKPSVVD
ncbi:NUDIX hydrolase [soil metagenome]